MLQVAAFFLKTLLSGLERQRTLKISILPWCSPLTLFSFSSFGWSRPGGFLAWHRLGFCWVLPFFGWLRLWALFGISWPAPTWLLLLYGVASVWEHTVYSFVIITIGNILTFFKKKKKNTMFIIKYQLFKKHHYQINVWLFEYRQEKDKIISIGSKCVD